MKWWFGDEGKCELSDIIISYSLVFWIIIEQAHSWIGSLTMICHNKWY